MARQCSRNLLPCQYFLITFTLPAGLREFAMAHPKVLYVAMMSAAAQALQQAATNPRHVGVSETGFTSVLHTWGRDLGYHPHVHVVVPPAASTLAESGKAVAPVCSCPSRFWRGCFAES